MIYFIDADFRRLRPLRCRYAAAIAYLLRHITLLPPLLIYTPLFTLLPQLRRHYTPLRH